MRKVLFFVAVFVVAIIGNLMAAKMLVIAPSAQDIAGLKEIIKGNEVTYWFIKDKGPVSGEEVFKFIGKDSFVIRVLGEKEVFSDDESMILEDYLSSRGAVAFFGASSQEGFFEFPLLKDYLLIAPGEELTSQIVTLYPSAKDVFGEDEIYIKGPVLSLKEIPEAPEWYRWGYVGKNGLPLSAVIQSCTFKALYFPFFWKQLVNKESREKVIEGCFRYFTASTTERIPSVGTVMKDFELVDLAGNKQSLSKYYGKKAVVLAYFATWCSHCQKELPLLEKYYDPTAPYQILAASFKEKKEVVEDFVEKYGITFPVMPDENGVLRRLYRIPTVPVLFFISSDGVLKYVHRGEISQELLEQKLAELVNSKAEFKNQELLLNIIINRGATELKKYVK